MLIAIVHTSESMITGHVRGFVTIISPENQEDMPNSTLQRTLKTLSLILAVLFPNFPDSLLTYHPALARDCLCTQVLLMK